MPGTDPVEASAVVVGELPGLPHMPELPKRGLGADMIGRTTAVLVDLAVEVVPSGYRVTARPGGDHRTAVDHLRRDLDAFEEAAETAKPSLVKVQLAGPWTLTSEVELPRGHRVMTDQGALRDFVESLAEGLTRHVAEVRKRTGADVVVQFDEPSLPAVLAGALPTPSGLSTVPAVAEPDARETLHDVARPVLELVDRLGFPRSLLAERAVPTPTCGLAGATATWARRALELTRDLGKAFVEPPESW